MAERKIDNKIVMRDKDCFTLSLQVKVRKMQQFSVKGEQGGNGRLCKAHALRPACLSAPPLLLTQGWCCSTGLT